MLENLPETLRTGLARLLLVLIVFGLIALVRSSVTWLLSRPLERLLRRARQTGLDERIRKVVNQLAGYLLLALAIDLSARILEFPPDVMTLVLRVTRTLVVISIALLVARMIDTLVLSRRQVYLLTGLTVDEALLPFIRTGAQLVALALGLVIVVQVWGYDVTGLIAGLGLGGLAISLAAQDTLSNIFGFAAIVSDRPFVVGEYIKTKDVEGAIEKVGLRSTRVRQLDQAVVSVPNSMLVGSAILNWSRLSRRKVELTLGVTYRTTPDQMESLLDTLRGLLSDRRTVDRDSVVVYFVGFADSALNILVRCYVNIPDWKEFSAEKERILIDIMRAVEDRGLQLALPSTSIYVENLNTDLLERRH
jgi:MscS family membrane protein